MARVPKYRRHTVRDLGFVEYDGKRTYFAGCYDSRESKKAYRDFLTAHGFLIVKHHEASHAIDLPQLADLFLGWADATYPTGRRSYPANLEAAIKLLGQFSGGVTLATAFTPLRMKAFQQWLAARGLSRVYINDTTRHVRTMFKWAVSEELVPVDLYNALQTVPGLRKNRSAAREPEPRKPVPWEHVQSTLPHLQPVVQSMVLFQWHTGVRPDSLCTARAMQFDQTANPWQWFPKHKSEYLDKSLTVFVGPQAQGIVAPLLDGLRPEDYVFRPANKAGKRSKRYRSFYDSGSYAQAVRRAAEAADVPHWTPHQLRHARATLVRERHGLEAAQAALGHARIDATQIYAQKQIALAKMVAETMG